MKSGEKIKKWCDKRGITHRELAELSGVTQAAMSRYINENRMPKATILFRMASALNVPAESLLDDDESFTEKEMLKKPVIGDGIKSHDSPREGVCLYPVESGCFVWWEDGRSGFYGYEHIRRNGKHFSNTEKLFREIREGK